MPAARKRGRPTRAKKTPARFSDQETTTTSNNKKQRIVDVPDTYTTSTVSASISEVATSTTNTASQPATPVQISLLSPASTTNQQHVTQSTVQQVAQPIVQQVAQPTVQQITQPTVQQVAQPTVQQVAQPKNAKSAYSSPQTITTAILKELKAGHAVGPFKKPPFPNFVVNSLGLRPKKNGGHRIIMDLSQPISDSVNDNINKEEFSLHYATVDDAVKMINQLGQHTQLAKVDIQHAF